MTLPIPNAGDSTHITDHDTIAQILNPTTTRPSSPATDLLSYNKSTELWERWDGTAWQPVGGTAYIAQTLLGAAGGVATLDDTGVVQSAQSRVASVDGLTGPVDLSTRYVPSSYLSNLRPVLIYSASTYPARPSWATTVEWQGPVDPGTAANDGDIWTNTA